jgi:hypothetical protein
MSTEDEVRAKYDLLKPYLKGRVRRLWAAAEATMIGRGGIRRVSTATGICAPTVSREVRELQDPSALAEQPRHRSGGRGSSGRTRA